MRRRLHRLICTVIWLSLVAFGQALGGTPSAGAVGVLRSGRGTVTQFGSLVESTEKADGTWTSVDLSTTYGQQNALSDGAPFVDPITGYQNAYVADQSGHLQEYTRFPAGNWSTVDLTAIYRGPALLADAEPFVDVGTHFQSVLATAAGNGDLVDYARVGSGGGWSVLDLTSLAGGQKVTGTPEPFVDPVTGFQNAYAAGAPSASPGGDLLEYTRLPNGQWISLDLTAVANSVPIVGTPRPFVDPLTHFQNVYASTVSGDLIEYTRVADGRWTSLDLTAAFDGPEILAGPRPTVDPLTGFQNVYATDLSGGLIEFTRLPDGRWINFDINAFYGGPDLQFDAVPFAVGATEMVFGHSSAGHLIQFIRQADGHWTNLDINATFGGLAITGNPAPFVDPVTHLLNVYYTDAAAKIIVEL